MTLGKILLFGFLGLLAIWLVLTGPGMVEAIRQKRAVEESFGKFVSRLEEKNFETAYRLCSVEFQEATPYDEFVRQQHKLERAYGPLQSSEIDGFELEGVGTPATWTAVIRAEMKFQRKNVTFTYELHNVSAEWRVFGYKEDEEARGK